MILSLRSRKLVSLLWNRVFILFLISACSPLTAQQLAAYHDNQEKFYIFDNGRTIEAEYLPVKSYSVGGRCILYTDNRNHLKMYYKGAVTELEVNAPTRFEALDYLSVYSIGGIVKIIDNGRTITISTNAIGYQAEDSLVTFYDETKSLLAVFYKGHIHMLEDGLILNAAYLFKAGDNLVAYVSSRTRNLNVFYRGENRVIESFQSGGDFKAGRDIVAYINQSDLKFKMYFRGEVFLAEEFPPQSWQVGDGIVAYVDNNGYFRVFSEGESVDISSVKPDFYKVINSMIIYSEKGYFKVWCNNRSYTLETFVPRKWAAEWNTVVYLDLNANVKIFSKGENKVLTYDLAEDIFLYRDVVVVNKGMNNHNVYVGGRKY